MSEHDSEEFSEAESESSENDSFPVPPPPSTQIPTPTQNTNTYNGNFGSPDPIPPPPMHPPIQDEEIVAKKLKMKLPPSLEKAKWVPPRHRGVSVGTLSRERYKRTPDGKPVAHFSTSKTSNESNENFHGKRRAIQAFNVNPSMDNGEGADVTRRRMSSMEDHNAIEITKQHLRGIFAAACTDHTAQKGEMRLNPRNLREAVVMTGLFPSKRLVDEFFEGGSNSTSVNLGRFLEVILETLAIDDDDDMKEPTVEDNLVELFHLFDEEGTGTMRIKDLRHLMMEVLTSDKTELSRAEFDEFLDYAKLEGDAEIDYKVLASNFMLNKPKPESIVIDK